LDSHSGSPQLLKRKTETNSDLKVIRELYTSQEEVFAEQLQAPPRSDRVPAKRKKTVVYFSDLSAPPEERKEESFTTGTSLSDCRSRKATPFKKFTKPLSQQL
jgi:hypothetical protein